MKKFLLSLLLVLGVCSLFSCQSDSVVQETDVEEEKEMINIPPIQSRAPNIKSLTIEDIFIRVPEDKFQLEGWDKLNSKYRKQLIKKGNLDNYLVKVNDNHIRIQEQFSNDDDDDEKAAIVDLVLFKHDTENYNVVFVAQHYHSEANHLPDERISQKFWEYDGRNWSAIKKEIPQVTTSLFFDEDFDLSKVKEDNIFLQPHKKDIYSLTAHLSYDQYEEAGFTKEELITNESYAVNLIWNGRLFELQRTSNEIE